MRARALGTLSRPSSPSTTEVRHFRLHPSSPPSMAAAAVVAAAAVAAAAVAVMVARATRLWNSYRHCDHCSHSRPSCLPSSSASCGSRKFRCTSLCHPPSPHPLPAPLSPGPILSRHHPPFGPALGPQPLSGRCRRPRPASIARSATRLGLTTYARSATHLRPPRCSLWQPCNMWATRGLRQLGTGCGPCGVVLLACCAQLGAAGAAS